MAFWCAVPSLMACGQAASSDAGPPDAGADAGSTAAPPDLPWLDDGVPPLELTPCPSGWREVTEGDLTTCDPYPEGGPATCDRGEAHFPGEPGCRPIGDPCPSGEFATTLPTDVPIVYVDDGAAPGGDGLIGAPYAALAEVGWVSLAPGTVVALGKGSYAGVLALKPGTVVMGACVAETTLTGTTAPAVAVVSMTGRGDPATVRNLSIASPPQEAVHLQNGYALSLAGVLIDRSPGYGASVLDSDSSLELSDTVIRDTQETSAGAGAALYVEGGGHITASRAILAGNQTIAVMLQDPGSEVTLSDSVVRETRSASDGTYGRAIQVTLGAHLDASRFLATENRDVAVQLGDEGTTVTLSDAILRDTQPMADGTMGRGLEVTSGGQLEATHLVLAGNRDVSVLVSGSGAVATIADAVIADTQEREVNGKFGHGLDVQEGARLEATRVVVQNSRDLGVFGTDPETTMVLTDMLVRDTHPKVMDDDYGWGIALELGASLEGHRLVIERSHDAAIVAKDEGTELSLFDSVVRSTAPRAFDLAFGTGVDTSYGAHLTAQRIVIDEAVSIGLSVYNGATAEVSDAVISRVANSMCECPESVAGHGVAVIDATVSMTDFAIESPETCGFFVASFAGAPGAAPTSLDARSGVVRGAAIGACIQIDGYDLSRIMDGVSYLDNGTNLDITSLPVPTSPHMIVD